MRRDSHGFLLAATTHPGLPLFGPGLALAALLSTWCWPLTALVRVRRASSRAPASFGHPATLPLVLSATILVAHFVALGIALRAMLTSQSPIVLMIGLPRALLPLYALPWLALGCTLWALVGLLIALGLAASWSRGCSDGLEGKQ